MGLWSQSGIPLVCFDAIRYVRFPDGAASYRSWWRTHAIVWVKPPSSRPFGTRSRKLYAPTRMSNPRA